MAEAEELRDACIVVLPPGGPVARPFLEGVIKTLTTPEGGNMRLIVIGPKQATASARTPDDATRAGPIAAAAGAAATGILIDIGKDLAKTVVKDIYDGLTTVIKDDYKTNLDMQQQVNKEATDYLQGLHDYLYG